MPVSCADRLQFLYLAMVCCALLGGAGAAAADEAERTNILLLFVDNVGYGDLGYYGNREVLTPRIDRLAREGVLCTDFYVGSPSCMPSRGALLTGRHPVRNGLNEQLWRQDDLEQVGLPHDETLLPSLLGEKGYVSGCFGKWNLGFGPGSRPTERGFDEFFGHASGNIDYYTHRYNGRNDLFRGTEPTTAEGYSTDLFADAACDFIRRHADRPFFCYVPFNAAHYPNPKNVAPGEPVIWQAPERSFAAYGASPSVDDERIRYRAVLTALDDAVGRILDELDRQRLAARTLVVLLSDNGAFMLPGRGLEVASNEPLRDGGVTVYEGGVRVPCLLRWPGRIEPGTVCREPLVSMDLFPLACRLAGADLPSDRVLDGKDPLAALRGEAASPHEFLYFQWGAASALRGGTAVLSAAGSQSSASVDRADAVPEQTARGGTAVLSAAGSQSSASFDRADAVPDPTARGGTGALPAAGR